MLLWQAPWISCSEDSGRPAATQCSTNFDSSPSFHKWSLTSISLSTFCQFDWKLGLITLSFPTCRHGWCRWTDKSANSMTESNTHKTEPLQHLCTVGTVLRPTGILIRRTNDLWLARAVPLMCWVSLDRISICRVVISRKCVEVLLMSYLLNLCPTVVAVAHMADECGNCGIWLKQLHSKLLGLGLQFLQD